MFASLMNWMRDNNILPQISDTERQALEAGDVWIDGQFFSGAVDFDSIIKEPYDKLPAHEQAFLDGPCEQLLDMADAYKMQRTRIVPDEIMHFMADNGFFALQIDEKYGGKPFSTQGKSAVMAKITPHSGVLSSLVVIPNSLGAAELLGHYGTEAQKAHYLPKLANGEYIPCFGLTEPTAGSDAASIKAEGEVFRADDDSIQIRMNFRKRYITLAPIANLISLAVRLHDPDNLLGKGEDAGITVVLLEKGLPGLHIGDHHEPIGEFFANGPIVGRDVVVPVEQVLGGQDYVGQGWRMLMESLAGGRMVSLPATGISAMRVAAAATGAYSMVRHQFGIPIGRMEGVETKVGKMASLSYMFEAARVFGCSAVDHGVQPPVTSAIMKVYSTECAREVGTDAMDIMAGSAVMQGPNNILGRGYCSAPVAITVEGANIMSRTLMIFGQGATRCHPHAYHVVEAVEKNDTDAFKRSLLGWLKQFSLGILLTFIAGLTRGYLGVKAPRSVASDTRHYYRRLGWAARRFGLMTNLAMFFIGGKLKARGNLTGRYADIVAWLYIASATLRRYEAEGRRQEDRVLVDYGVQYALAQIQHAYEGLYENFDGALGWFFRTVGRIGIGVNPLAKMPTDQQANAAAQPLQRYDAQFLRLYEGMYLPKDTEVGLGRLFNAFQLYHEAEPVRVKIKDAQKSARLVRGKVDAVAEQACALGVISAAEYALLKSCQEACLRAIEVDVFTREEFVGQQPHGVTATGNGGQRPETETPLMQAADVA
ncbi:MAG: acyl-CoA dehydrogenase [Pseudomonadales bacterium]|nr:acyl-CoA dehydrogenase [Pseudomonadales bacterium]